MPADLNCGGHYRHSGCEGNKKLITLPRFLGKKHARLGNLAKVLGQT